MALDMELIRATLSTTGYVLFFFFAFIWNSSIEVPWKVGQQFFLNEGQHCGIQSAFKKYSAFCLKDTVGPGKKNKFTNLKGILIGEKQLFLYQVKIAM